MLFLGVDAGGSTCRARIQNAAGRVLGEGQAGPANARIGAARVAQAVMAACRAALAAAGLNESALAGMAAGMGVAGIERGGARQALRRALPAFRHLAVASDGEIAHWGAHGGADGGTVIVGTGSVALATVGGRQRRIGGYGFPVSDAGSGAAIGLAAMRAALEARDGLVAASALSEDVLARFGGDIAAVIAWLDAAGATEFAALAPLVVAHAEKGDRQADRILATAASDVGRLARALLDWGAPKVALVGGLAPALAPRLDAAIQDYLAPPQADPLAGAIVLARRGISTE
ncbi:MAG: N-acetylglucosamine kinase [Alphaproteobacteria bacterium]|nr:MAG: N-acetylglucosamine kinase [Alphaproteobacteria bacterium]